MAEERLIDDDKDRKFKIIKNEDGEDELVIDDSEETDENQTPVIDIYEYEDEEDLTPAQLAEREKLRLEAKEAERAKFEEGIKKAEKYLEEGDFESAVYNLNQIEEFAEHSGDYYCLKLKTLSRNFTDFVSLEKCAKASKGVKEFASAEQKAELKELSKPYENKLKEVEEKTNRLHKENEQKKEERRSTFLYLFKRAAKNLALAGVPFTIALVLLITFGSMMFAAENGVYLVLTIVFASLSAIALIFTLVTLRKFLEARRRVKLNEKDGSTALGREYLNSKSELEYIKIILSSFENDLS